MGYMRHHCIVVTGQQIEAVHAKATELFTAIPGAGPSPITPKTVNGYQSFFCPPDGSKEGWDTSADGDMAREAFVDWLNTQRYADGSSPFDWTEVQYGDDDGETKIVRHSDECSADRGGGLRE